MHSVAPSASWRCIDSCDSSSPWLSVPHTKPASSPASPPPPCENVASSKKQKTGREGGERAHMRGGGRTQPSWGGLPTAASEEGIEGGGRGRADVIGLLPSNVKKAFAPSPRKQLAGLRGFSFGPGTTICSWRLPFHGHLPIRHSPTCRGARKHGCLRARPYPGHRELSQAETRMSRCPELHRIPCFHLWKIRAFPVTHALFERGL